MILSLLCQQVSPEIGIIQDPCNSNTRTKLHQWEKNLWEGEKFINFSCVCCGNFHACDAKMLDQESLQLLLVSIHNISCIFRHRLI